MHACRERLTIWGLHVQGPYTTLQLLQAFLQGKVQLDSRIRLQPGHSQVGGYGGEHLE